MKLSVIAIERLRAEGIDPSVAGGTEDLLETAHSPGEFETICRWSGWPVAHRWIPGGDPQGWVGDRPALFWPLGRAGATVLVTLGAGSCLAIASLLVEPDGAGGLRWREGLPKILDVVPACLPETAPGEAREWCGPGGGAEELFTQLVSPQLRAVYTAIPAGPDAATLIGELAEICANCEVVLRVVPDLSWDHVSTSERTKVLAGRLEIALAPPFRNDPTNDAR